MQEHIEHNHHSASLIRRCHKCGQITESHLEQTKCVNCGKAFMPLNYFDKVHNHTDEYEALFAPVEELEEKDLIKGLFVLW